MIDTNKLKIKEILERGVEDVFVKENLEKRLLSGDVLRVKLGFDPTGPKIHIGRAIVLRKLKAFQDLGHKVVFIVGDFTAQVGDPSDKLSKRPMLEKETIEENLKDYKKQIGKIIDLDKAEFHYNSQWLSKLGFREISELAESFSVPQMANRRNFKERLDKGEEVSLREFLYPLMQGYDSVAVESDVELGGFDQLFNLKAGRIVQKHYNQREQDVLTCSMLLGTDGRKMSTSWGNVINITDEPNDMFGKVMSLKDELILDYYLLCTDLPLGVIDSIKIELESKKNYRDAKVGLAKEIVSIYHSKELAIFAEENFNKTFRDGGIPEDILQVESSDKLLIDICIENKLVESKTEFKRLVDKGAVVELKTDSKVSDWKTLALSGVYRIGKKRFIQIL
jgi:tyrosyl-tRNA synthetase